jgi:putative glutamine amidotransferase
MLHDRGMHDRPTLLVLDVSDRERADAVYGRVLEELTARASEDATRVGFRTERVACDGWSESAAATAVAGADAVLVMGGEDVSPDLYGAASDYPGAGDWFRGADLAQIAAVREAVSRRVPVLGICRGMQLANVALGGTLVPHIDGHVRPGPADASMVDHEVALAAESALARALGAQTLSVRSSHHQAVDRLGDGLRPVAAAPDGVVEALEHTDAPLWAVQWHPEDAGAGDDVLTRLLALARSHVRG